MTKHNKKSLNSRVVLIILDGWGDSSSQDYNAIAAANTPTWDNLITAALHSKIDASGNSVGLPKDQMGNSEVGHATIGAGRIIEQDLVRINNAINYSKESNQCFFNNAVLLKNIKAAINSQQNIHILGLLSDGGVHSHNSHLHALLQLIHLHNANNKTNTFVHAFLDGRDTPPKSATKYLSDLEHLITSNKHNAKIASISGRFFAMDRDNRFERTKKIYDLLTSNSQDFTAINALDGLQQAYDRSETDEFVSPTKINLSPPIKDGDLVIFYNFRTDRTRQLCSALTQSNFSEFNRNTFPKIKLITFTKYSDDIHAEVVFPAINLNNVLSKYLADLKVPQLKIAETEKYPHVTFFFNGGQEAALPLEDRILIGSPKVKTYDLAPEMSAIEITAQLLKAIKQRKYSLIVCNFANTDMVAHTGNITATIKAVEVIDQCLAKIITTIKNTNTDLIITADHGNAELMYDIQNAQPLTSHTNAPVPFIYLGTQKATINKERTGSLQDIAPTILDLLKIDKPQEMTGESLLVL